MDTGFNSYSINADTFGVVETFGDEYYKMRVLKDSNGTEIIIAGEDYSRLWGRDISGDVLAKEIAQVIASFSPDFLENDDYADDIRYAVYYDSGKFVALKLTDDTVSEFNKENFVRSPLGMLEFFRRDFHSSNVSSDEVASAIAEKICTVMNKARIYK